MPIVHAIVLGLVQGLSEFLPISSSGHLLIVPWLFGWDDLADPGIKKAFDVALHIGTMVAVVGYFRRDLVVLVRDGLREGASRLLHRRSAATEHGRFAWMLVLSCVPAAVVGAVLEDWIDERLGTPFIIALSLIAFGVVLAWADRRTGDRATGEFGTREALLVGAAQVLALNPGTSRSGITMSAARANGFSRDAAARISFLMSIPVTAGAIVVKVGGLVADGVPDGLIAPMIAGIVTSALSGWLAVWGLLRLVRTRNFDLFVFYRVAAGVAILIALASSWR